MKLKILLAIETVLLVFLGLYASIKASEAEKSMIQAEMLVEQASQLKIAANQQV